MSKGKGKHLFPGLKCFSSLSIGNKKMSGNMSNSDRDSLFHKIRNTLLEWPELERRVFSQSHYEGQSPEAISRSLQLDVDKVSEILKECDRRINILVRSFRTGKAESCNLFFSCVCPVQTVRQVLC
jgi:hypothetical protein